MPNLTHILAIGFLLLASIPFASGQNVPDAAMMVQRERILSVATWDTGEDDLLCIVSEGTHQTAGGQSLPARVLTVYQKEGKRFNKIFERSTADTFISAYPLSESGGRFFTSWTGGSAYHFEVLAYVNGKVKEVLNVSSRGMPEIVIDGNEQESFLITHMNLTNGTWSRRSESVTDIYRWTGEMYEKTGTAKWAERFKQLDAGRRPGGDF